MNRSEHWNRLIDLLEQADHLQQTLLNEKHPVACYEFHSQLNQIADELTDFANAESIDIC
jgi:hypothetical protein